MELNSVEDVRALNEYRKIEQIQSIEKKFHRLGLVPYLTYGALSVYAILKITSLDHQPDGFHLFSDQMSFDYP